MKKAFYSLIFLWFCIFKNVPALSKNSSYYILIDKTTNQLKVMDREKIVTTFEIGWGLRSELPKQKKGDFLTPEGVYEILDWRTSSQYLYFIELNYPNLNDLAWAYYQGLLNTHQFEKFSNLFYQRKRILSPLGTEIGIHGGGAFKEEKKKGQTYKNYNWTKGCIALSNEDLLKLLNLISINQRVFILNSSKSLYGILEKLVYPKEVKPLEFFEGEVSFKIDNSTYYKFILKKYFRGLKYLTFQEWKENKLVRELNSKADGTFEASEEEFLKDLIISKIYLMEIQR